MAAGLKHVRKGDTEDMKRVFIFFGFFVLCLGGILGIRYVYIRTSYPEVLERNESKRLELSASYKQSKTKADRKSIRDQARIHLNEILTASIFPAWYGTPWSFNGNAPYPLQGSVACGAFVENVLKNVGFRIDPGTSNQPSEYIIKNLCNENDIARFSNASLKSFNHEVQSMGEGIYLVGLDSHVGFLYLREGSFRFVHSHGYLFVLSEPPALSLTLRRSRYRVVGKLFSDQMIEKWLDGGKIFLRYDYLDKKN